MAGGELLGKDEGKKTKNIDYETREPNFNLHKRAKKNKQSTNKKQHDRIDTKCAAYSNTSTAIVLGCFEPSPTFKTKFPLFNTKKYMKREVSGYQALCPLAKCNGLSSLSSQKSLSQMVYLSVQVVSPDWVLFGDEGHPVRPTLPRNCCLPEGTSKALLKLRHSLESAVTTGSTQRPAVS